MFALLRPGAFLAIAVAAVVLTNVSLRGAEPVTVSNFARAETDSYFGKYAKQGGFGRLMHIREITPIDEQDIVKMNRDTLYSGGVFDVSSPLTIAKPDSDGRFQSMLVINQDHYVKMIEHGAGEFTLDLDNVGSRYAMVVFRTLVDADDPADVKAAHAAQDALAFQQSDSGEFDVPDWDTDDLKAIRASLTELGKYTPSTKGRFGDKQEIDPINHLIGTAVGWGGNPPAAAVYAPFTPANNDGTTEHELTVKDVPVEGFWSICVYNEEGFFEKNNAGAYVINDRNAVRNADGSITIHFGGDPTQDNYLHIMKGWQCLVRLYQPRQEVIDGKWTFPKPMPSR